jgi:transcriptional regulator with XRE-family HTH domain
VEFPQRLATLRRTQGLTQTALAERIGVHVSQLRRYEAGQAEPTLGVLRQIAVALSVPTDVLVFGDDPRLAADERLALAFEATVFLDDQERSIVLALLEAFLSSHEARRGHVGPRGARAKSSGKQSRS